MKILLSLPDKSGLIDKIQVIETIPNISLAYLGSTLRRDGFEVKVVDPRNTDLFRVIESFSPNLIGFSAYTEEVKSVARTALRIKKDFPEKLIVLGGAHASALPILTLKEFPVFDACVVGEGEIPLVRIARGEDFKDIDGLAFRQGDKVRYNPPLYIKNLDALPFPDWNLFDLKSYAGEYTDHVRPFRKQLELPVSASRGCPFKCSFCFNISKNYRSRSAENVFEELKRNVRVLGAKRIQFVDPTFGVDKKQAEKLCSLLIESGLGKEFEWFAGTRVELASREFMENVKRAGCSNLFIGVESGDQEILNGFKMGVTTRQIRKVFENAKKIGLNTHASFILGLPGETRDSLKRTIEFAKGLDTKFVIFSILTPYPGTKVFDLAGTFDWDLFGKESGKALKEGKLSSQELKSFQILAYKEFYKRPDRALFLLRTLGFRKFFSNIKESVF
ncbi:MAG: radical SAM protein [Nanoarchaeota archaeon]|nr:radical SAM protein [Nanoarchaeota archaeon]